MSYLLSNARIQTLTRLINRANEQIMLLSQQAQTLTNATAQLTKEYQTCYYYTNTYVASMSDDEKQDMKAKLNAILPNYYVLSEKDNDIQLEIKSLETKVKAYNGELENVKKALENQAKKDAPKLTM